MVRLKFTNHLMTGHLGLDLCENDYGELEQQIFTYVDNITYEVSIGLTNLSLRLRDLGNR